MELRVSRIIQDWSRRALACGFEADESHATVSAAALQNVDRLHEVLQIRFADLPGQVL